MGMNLSFAGESHMREFDSGGDRGNVSGRFNISNLSRYSLALSADFNIVVPRPRYRR